MFRLLLLSFTLIAFRPAGAATFEIQQFWGNRDHLILWGEILPHDDERFKALVLQELRSGRVVTGLHLYTPGGNVEAAIAIGNQVRLAGMTTYSPDRKDGSRQCFVGGFDRGDFVTDDRCECASACFIVWAGGAQRQGNYVGVHRPYFTQDYYKGLSADQAMVWYAGIDIEVRAYFKAMEIPDWIVGVMFSYSSQQMHYLDDNELKQVRRAIPYLEEYLLARCGTMPSGNYQSNPERKAYMDCTDSIFASVYARDAQKFLDKYGEPNEKFTPSARPTPPPRPQPTPAPQPSPTPVPPRPAPAPPAPSPPAPAPPQAEDPLKFYTTRDNRDMDGRDIAPMIRSTTLKDCAAACRKNSQCSAFSFDKWNRACFLKADIRALRLDPKSLSGYDSRYTQMTTVGDTAKMVAYHGKFFPGDSYAASGTATSVDCSNVCSQDLKCVAFNYNKSNRSCSLFNTVGEYFRDDNIEAGTKTQVF